MDAFFSLVSRHNKVFLRNRMLVFFSMLSVIIVIALYAIFLQQTQINAIEQVVPVTDAIRIMVNEWMVAGLLSIIAVTTTLAVFGIYVKDLETKVSADFLTTAISRTKIQLSYVCSAFMIGLFLSLLAFVCCEIFLVIMGAEWLSFEELVKIVAILILCVTLSSTINLFFVLFIKTQTTFSTFNTIVGTVIGFLCGVYVPIGALPTYVQSIIHYFPISHTTLLMRQALMSDSINDVFLSNDAAANNYMIQNGVKYEIDGQILTASWSVLFIVLTIVIVGAISVFIFARKNK